MGFIKRCNKIIKNNLIMQHTCPDIHLHGLATCVIMIVIVMELDLDLTGPVIPVGKVTKTKIKNFITMPPFFVKRWLAC